MFEAALPDALHAALHAAWHLFAAVLALNLAVGLVRVLRGPASTDRLLAAQLLGSTGVALLLTLAALQGWPSLRDVALVFALLGLLAAVFYARLRPPALSAALPLAGNGRGAAAGPATAPGAVAAAADANGDARRSAP